MPIEVSPMHFVSYIYNPDYLQDKRQYITTDINACYDFTSSKCFHLAMVIDGGNVIKCGDKIIMTEKVFWENPNYTSQKLRKRIENAFQAELIVIPKDEEDKCGHADGMVRFIGPSHIVINAYKDYNQSLRRKMMDALSPHFNAIDELEFGKANRKISWAHINFLQVGKILFVPLVNKPSDGIAIEQIKAIFGSNYEVHGVEIENIVKHGGALNCVSWNVSKTTQTT